MTGHTDSAGSLDSIKFADNPEPRCSCVILLDVSNSMSGERIRELNHALQRFEKDIKDSTLKASRSDIAVVAFNHETWVVKDFTNGHDFKAPTLSASGGTRMSSAIHKALDMCETRKETYRRNGIAYYRSMILLLTDGRPELDSYQEKAAVADRLLDEENAKKVACFGFGVIDADLDEMNRILVRKAWPLERSTQIGGVMEWLSNSLAVVSQSQTNEQVSLPDPRLYF